MSEKVNGEQTKAAEHERIKELNDDQLDDSAAGVSGLAATGDAQSTEENRVTEDDVHTVASSDTGLSYTDRTNRIPFGFPPTSDGN